MSKQEKKTKEQLQNEYAHVLAQIGEISYRKKKMDEDIKRLYEHVDKIQSQAEQMAKEEQHRAQMKSNTVTDEQADSPEEAILAEVAT